MSKADVKVRFVAEFRAYEDALETLAGVLGVPAEQVDDLLDDAEVEV